MRVPIAVLVLAVNMWALTSLFGSGAGARAKIGWTIVIVVLPLIGFVVWLWSGPKARGARRAMG